MSGNRRCARLKRAASRVQVGELGVGGQIQQCKSLRRRQTDRCCDHHRIGLRHDGAHGFPELATAIARKYDVKVSQDQETRDAFRSVQHLAEFITQKRAELGGGRK